MGAPAHIPLLVDATYDDYTAHLNGILVGDQPFTQAITLVDPDKTGGTKLLGTTTLKSPADRAELFYDGKSFVNPKIYVAGDERGSRQMLVPFLRTREYALPSHTLTSTNAGFGRLLRNDDGSITFLENSGFGRIDANGAITETKLGLYDYDIAIGSDKHVWALVTTNGNDALARVNDDGSLTQFPLPYWNVGPMVLGPDGNFWTPGSNDAGMLVRRVTPTGVVTDFPISYDSLGLTGVVAGTDGNVWFTGAASRFPGASGSGLFLKVRPNGTYSAYWLPGIDQPCCSTPVVDPVWGINGKLYTSIGYANLGQTSESGAFHEFRAKMQVETPAASPPILPPMGVAPDGAMWYPAQGLYGLQCVLGRATTSGQIAFVQLTSNCSGSYVPNELPTGFVSGPNNTLWYTRGYVVGKIML